MSGKRSKRGGFTVGDKSSHEGRPSIAYTPHGEKKIHTKGDPPSGRYQFNHTALSSRLELLKCSQVRNKFVVDLTGRTKDYFDEVKSAVNHLYGTDDYRTIIGIIIDKWRDVIEDRRIEIIPGTIAAYFTGCFAIISGFTGNPACLPICAGSVHVPQDTQGCEVCKNQSILYLGGEMKKLNDPQQREERKYAYVFVPRTDDFAFTPADIMKLRNYAIESVKVVFYDPSGRGYQSVSETFIPLADLKVRPSPSPATEVEYLDRLSPNPTPGGRSPAPAPRGAGAPRATTPTGQTRQINSVTLTIIIVVVMLLLVIIAVALYMRYRPKPTPMVASPVMATAIQA